MMERTPLRHYESQSMQFLMGLSQEAETACKTLAKRLEMTGNTEKMRRIADDTLEIATDMLKTVPEEKLDTIRMNWANMEMALRIRRAVNIEEANDFTYVQTGALRDVLKTFAEEKCCICLGMKEDEKKCVYRKTLDKLLMEDLPENGSFCKYKNVHWAEEEE